MLSTAATPIQVLPADLADWSLVSQSEGRTQLVRRFTFPNFVAAMAFANQLTPLAEAAAHHPDLSIGWGRVDVVLSTHDAGHQVTNKDLALARQINALT